MTEAEFNNSLVKSYGGIEITLLKEKTLESPRKRYRYCLHDNTNHLTQEMIICMNGFSYFRPHKHPKGNSESYHMLDGQLDIFIFDDQGKVLQIVKLSSKESNINNDRDLIYRLSGSKYHLMIPQSEWVIFHEVSTGPFDTSKIQEADFAPLNNCSLIEAENYCKSLYKF